MGEVEMRHYLQKQKYQMTQKGKQINQCLRWKLKDCLMNDYVKAKKKCRQKEEKKDEEDENCCEVGARVVKWKVVEGVEK